MTQSPVKFLSIRNWHKDPIEVAWEKPEIGWAKLNFDGSCKGKSGKSSIGGVLRNHKAEFLFGYAESIGKSTSVIAELAALRRGLELVLEDGSSDHVWLEGDSKTLVKIITEKRIVKCKEARRHVNDINLMMPMLSNCILSHVYREGNRVADKFAKKGHKLEKLEIWREVPPYDVLAIMHEDAVGKSFLRRR